jgi:hypothetical protein
MTIGLASSWRRYTTNLIMEWMSERVDDYQAELSDYGRNYGIGNDGGPLHPNERK